MHPTKAIINIDRLCFNYNLIKRLVGGSVVICVVKADAYGHGAERCALSLRHACGADTFAVANIDEAVSLRQSIGAEPTIIILGYTNPEDARELINHNIVQTVFSPEYADALCSSLRGASHSAILPKLRIHIKVDTGMNRLGFSCDEVGIRDIRRVCANPLFSAEGIFTHFACSDERENPMTGMQFAAYMKTLDELTACGLTFPMRHVCNSAATINFPHMRLDAVRCGVILYGLSPSEETRLDGLLPVMTLRTEISHVHTLRPGDGVSYGSSFTADRDMRVATLPIGYADGYIRAYGRYGSALICGKSAKILGRVCMDQCVVDISNIPEATVGSEAVMFGDKNPIDTLARAAYTLNYETVCLVGKRVKRIYQ